ncbi:hypothetical protein [Flexivirga oryzae]|uniref:Uncharacterized protein n=1 Tax=Flexivirga oryzae TaxID=1794944 RepID=A0A839N383_9MICO|nr:hypothetical protein [Flexivirga oryzae]MBB2892198.1 hypothetical protein [Flexivirga oryzae]
MAETDPFDELDHTMRGVRLLSKAILAAIERHDVPAIESLSRVRADLEKDVDRLLVVTDRIVRHE